MRYTQKIKKALASSEGFVDIQSVMVGVLVSAILAGTAVVGVIGFTRMVSDDTSKTTLNTISMGLETYYTDKDKYPATMAELADGKYVPMEYKNIPKTELCYAPAVGTYPQTYTTTMKSSSTNNIFQWKETSSEAAKVTTTFPASTTCK